MNLKHKFELTKSDTKEYFYLKSIRKEVEDILSGRAQALAGSLAPKSKHKKTSKNQATDDTTQDVKTFGKAITGKGHENWNFNNLFLSWAQQCTLVVSATGKA